MTTDAGARHRIRADLDSTLFVEAGAGSGKTTALVSRVMALVETGIPIERIATITFTEKAAIELRSRLRRAFETNPSARAQAALLRLDRAAIGTLHGFARRILTEHAVAAGLPTRVEVRDEIMSQLAFDLRWRADLERLVEAAQSDQQLAEALLLLRACDVNEVHYRQLARALASDWDRVATWGPPEPARLPPFDVESLVGEIRKLVDIAEGVAVRFPDDRLVVKIRSLDASADLLERADRFNRVRLVAGLKGVGNLGRLDAWGPLKAEVVARWQTALDTAQLRRQHVVDAAIAQVAAVLGRWVIEAADDRRDDGELEFHDLLVLARRMLRDPVRGREVRAALHDRYQRVLLDEFQDTDPIQLEVACLITATTDGDADNDAGIQPPVPVPGRLFVVGDPKQSIYRFRRADIAMYLGARHVIDGDVILLTQNFRSAEPIIEWINRTFGELVVEKARQQAAYTALVSDLPSATVGPPVVRFGREHHDLRADEVRVAEAADVVSLIVEANQWTVRADAGWRTSRLADIAILLPTRISLPALEDALTRADIAYRTESSSLVYATREIRALMLAFRAIEDPSDELALAEALRTPLFGCSDVDLLQWRVERGGRWNLTLPMIPHRLSIGSYDPVHDAFVLLRTLHDAKRWLSPAAILDQLIRERRCFEVAVRSGRYRDVWRRLRFVVDQARAWSDAGGRGIRSYLDWVHQQGQDGARVAEAMLPETDDDAVRILTIHAAKGLEFPTVIVAGLSTRRGGSGGGVQVRWIADTPELQFRRNVSTTDFDATRELDDQMDHEERLRLLYVACTRARDHLCVSVHRGKPAKAATPATLTSAALLFVASQSATHRDGCSSEIHAGPGIVAAAPAAPAGATTEIDDLGFERLRSAALDQASRRLSVSPSGLAAVDIAAPGLDDSTAPLSWPPPGLVKDARSLELPAWNRGRYGTAIGRAVHAVLQRVDLSTGAGITEAAAAQAAAEGIFGHESTIEVLVGAALRSPTIVLAAAAEHWREMYVGTSISATVLEGYIDLVYRNDDGDLVVVDYQTDAVTADDVDEKVDRYRLQGAAYAVALEAVTGMHVAACLFVFCRPDGPIERRLDDLDAAKADVLSRLAEQEIATTSGPSTTPIA